MVFPELVSAGGHSKATPAVPITFLPWVIGKAWRHLNPVSWRRETPDQPRNQVTNCGESHHQPECLCDVVVQATTPINFGLTDTWHGEAIARAMNLGVPWSSSDVATFGEALLKAYDIWSSDTRRGERIETEALRIKVCDLLRAGESMVDVAHILGQSWQHVIEAMTNGVPATVWSWDEDAWRAAEAIIYDSFKTHTANALTTMLGGVHHCVIEQLAEWYGVTVNAEGQTRMDFLKGLLRDGLHPIDVVIRAEEAGIKCNNEQLYMMRSRLVQRGELCSVMPRRLAFAAA